MQRQARLAVAAALVFSAAGALAQGGDLAGVTMRVLDDVSDVDAVLLELDANSGEGEEGASAGRDTAAGDEERNGAAARPDDGGDEPRRAARRDRDDLHDVKADERGEGRLEDRDVERPAVPPATVP